MIDAREKFLSLESARKRYGHTLAIDIPALDLYEGEALNLIGGNASGKSTLLRVLAGVSVLSAGRVCRCTDWRTLKKGFLPQRGGIYPNLTVAENLRLHAKLRGAELDDNLAVEPVVRAFDLKRVLDVGVSTLSGGMARLCAVAAVLCVQPEVLFLDEPWAGLDDAHKSTAAELINAMRSSLRLLVVSDHAANELFSGSSSIRLENGRLK